MTREQSQKAVGFGLGFELGSLPGAQGVGCASCAKP